jgi:hypothetical protein
MPWSFATGKQVHLPASRRKRRNSQPHAKELLENWTRLEGKAELPSGFRTL